MKKTRLLLACLLVMGVTAQAIIIDDFEDGNLSEYTSTVILDNNGGASNTANWQITNGMLQLNTTVYDGIEQYAMIYNGLSLAVGEEIQATISHTGASQDLGLYVGGTTPQTGVRQDYVAVYARADGQLYTRGFDGTGEFGLVGGGNPTFDKLFIARTATNTFETGYYADGVRTVMVTRTPNTPNDADVVGFYADVRAVGVLGNVDSLELWSPLWAPHDPDPFDGNLAAGTPQGNNTVDIDLSWMAALDPADESQVNPDVTKHYVFLGAVTETDPNLYYLGTVAQPQPDTDASTTIGTVTDLPVVTEYEWAVVEAVTGHDQQSLAVGVSMLSDVDPNNIVGPTWSFSTAAGVDRRLVGEYLFENNLQDSTVENNDGNAADPNAPTFDNTDPLSAGSGYYAVLDGVSNYINFGTGAYPKAGPFPHGIGGGLEEGTITAWIKPSQVGGLLSTYNDGTTTGFALSLADNNGLVDTRINVRGEAAELGTVQGRPGMTGWDMLGDGQWHMVAATWKRGETVTVYVDGGQVASVAAGTPTDFADWQYGVLFGATRTAADRTVLQNYYGGFVDNLRIYNYEVAPETIANEYYTVTGNPACTNPGFEGSVYNFVNAGSSYCKIDLADFAEFASAWLASGLTTGE